MSTSFFGDEMVVIEVKFWFEQHTIPNETLVTCFFRFVMDVLQKARIVDSESQVVKLTMTKAMCITSIIQTHTYCT